MYLKIMILQQQNSRQKWNQQQWRIKNVHRARNIDANPDQNSSEAHESPSSSLEIFSDKETQRMIENKDHNSDITAHRYPNSNPDNHEDMGNIKLDE